jgi:3-oxoacid CoA-transferase subunit A
MIYITGDTHRDFTRVTAFCDRFGTTKDDTLIILGDVGINYFGGSRDHALKVFLSNLPITLLCVHGNHEQRPEPLGYEETDWNGGTVYNEPDFPALLFAKDGEVYCINDKRCIVIGGAYSVDKPIRLYHGWGWWPDEQPSAAIKERVEQRLESENWKIDVVLSHTNPSKYEPVETFIQGIDQSGIDKTTEIWLGGIESRLNYSLWYCGHYHFNKVIDRMRFLYTDIREFD